MSAIESEIQCQCQLCGKLLQTKEKFLDHLNRHLDYRKYPCNSCKKKFFSVREREEHCEKELHDHVFNTESKPYCEMMLVMLQKDHELLKSYDSEVVIAGRRKCNADFEKKVNELQLKNSTSSEQTEVSKGDVKKACRPRKRGLSNSAVEEEISPSAISQEKPSRAKKASACSTTLQSKNAEPNQSPIEPLRALPRNDAAMVLCGICNKKVEIGYVTRKDHVSKKHLGCNHSDEDYVSLLETTMKRAFPDFSYSDIQCQQCQRTVRISRRNHVYETHVLKRIDCPVGGCTFNSLTVVKMNKHLKKDHNLTQGYRSIENPQLRADFEQTYREHNNYVEALVEQCFPCAIPICYQNQETKKSSISQPPQLFNGLRERFCQENPKTMPLRRLSESSDSNESLSNISLIEISSTGSEKKEQINEESMKAERCGSGGNDTPLEFAVDDAKSVHISENNSARHLGTEESSQVETDCPKESNNMQVAISQPTVYVSKSPRIIKSEAQPGDEIDKNTFDVTTIPNRFNQQHPRRFETRWDQACQESSSFSFRSQYSLYDQSRTGAHHGYASIRRPETGEDRYSLRRSPRRHTSYDRDSGRRYSNSNSHRSISRHDLGSRRSYEANDYTRHSYRDGLSTPCTSRYADGSSRSGGSRPLYTMRSNDR